MKYREELCRQNRAGRANLAIVAWVSSPCVIGRGLCLCSLDIEQTHTLIHAMSDITMSYCVGHTDTHSDPN